MKVGDIRQYRALLIGNNDQVFAVRPLSSENDATALYEASAITLPCVYVEVWRGPQRIGAVEPLNKVP